MGPYTTVLGAIVSIGLLASPAAAATRLGGINMASACRYQYWDENIQVVQTGNTCNDWKCYDARTGDYKGLTLQKACERQYGGDTYPLCYTGVYDWACYRN
jgi:hypothetical protein